jgi:methyl-accepting chemotaxis protein
VTIRAKLYAAIVLTILGPLATTAVALYGMSQLGDRFDEVRAHARKEALALGLKFSVTDVNGWQTAYGYDAGRSRPEFLSSVAAFRRRLRAGAQTLTEPRERELLRRLRREFADFMGLDVAAYRELRAGREERTREIFLGPEVQRFEEMAATADDLARHEARRAAATERAFDDARDDARRRLIAVAAGAAVVIVLLLVTANDIARMALEGERSARRRPGTPAED